MISADEQRHPKVPSPLTCWPDVGDLGSVVPIVDRLKGYVGAYEVPHEEQSPNSKRVMSMHDKNDEVHLDFLKRTRVSAKQKSHYCCSRGLRV